MSARVLDSFVFRLGRPLVKSPIISWKLWLKGDPTSSLYVPWAGLVSCLACPKGLNCYRAYVGELGRCQFSATWELIDFLKLFARHGIGPFKWKAFSVFVETGRHWSWPQGTIVQHHRQYSFDNWDCWSLFDHELEAEWITKTRRKR